jgi:hypothetical protein
MTRRHAQTGATLITALVMLVVLTLLVLSAIRSSTVNLRIAGNMQMRNEAIAAGQQLIENVLSNNFTSSPAATSIIVPIGGTSYAASAAVPTCIGTRVLMNNEPGLPTQCLSSGSVQSTGIRYSSGVQAGGQSWCYAQQWDVQANVTDPATGASAEIHQGVRLNVPAGTECL